ncbi:MAG: hypothetical protein MJY57_04185, partial [Bacteroidales bacterium]|nr:hypothetical protein [Bacteroidales bacterium]
RQPRRRRRGIAQRKLRNPGKVRDALLSAPPQAAWDSAASAAESRESEGCVGVSPAAGGVG